MATEIKSGQTIVFLGDSITDAGRRDGHPPLGQGFVKLFHDLLLIREPQKRVRVVNKGVGGDRIPQLRDRLVDDVLREKPDWLVVQGVINDLISFLCDPREPVCAERYEDLYDGVLTRTRAALPDCRLMLIAPFFLSIEPESDTLWRGRVRRALPPYIEAVQRLSKKHETRLVEPDEMFQHLLQFHSLEALAPEPVHPHATGNLALAEAVYRALE